MEKSDAGGLFFLTRVRIVFGTGIAKCLNDVEDPLELAHAVNKVGS